MAHPILITLLVITVLAAVVITSLLAPAYGLSLVFIVLGALVIMMVRGHNGLVISAIMEILGFVSAFVPAITLWSAHVFGSL